jgi:ParB/RepB/Spo0J family partition protein
MGADMGAEQWARTDDQAKGAPIAVVPTGTLLTLSPNQLRPNPTNPRLLFDSQPLHDLKENIRTHGVLVPITVYKLAGQDSYAILDGERRYRCCRELEDEGLEIRIPANVVEPPNTVASMLYMFNIHNYRQPWELMPTALSLKFLIDELGERDERKLANLTGLDEKQVQRCLTLLAFPEKYQDLSLDADPKTRIPSNFWIELDPVVKLCETELPDLVSELGRDGIIDRLVAKYRGRKITSVVHLRRILEAREVAEGQRQAVLVQLRQFVLDPDLETRVAFDRFIAESRQVQSALNACGLFLDQIRRAQVANVVDDRVTLMKALKDVRSVADDLIARLSSAVDGPADDVNEDAE